MLFRKKYASMTSDFENYLKSRNCQYNKETEDERTTYRFDYQGGHFVASVRDKYSDTVIYFLACGEYPLSQLDQVRSACNYVNEGHMLFKTTYSIEHEHNCIKTHISFFINIIRPESLDLMLSCIFQASHELNSTIDKAIDAAKQHNADDLEWNNVQNARETYLLRQQELRHQQLPDDLNSGTQALTLQRVLNVMAPQLQPTFRYMTVNTADGQQRIEDAGDIQGYDLRRVLTTGEGQDAAFARDYALIDLHYTEGTCTKSRMLTIAVTAEGADEHALYSRITVTTPPRNVSATASLNNKEARYPHSMSLLTALDRSTDKQHYQEFDYMWTDAQLKLKNGETLDEDQMLLCRVTTPQVAYNLYWGQQMFNDERYVEAIIHYENVFNYCRRHYFDMKKEDKGMLQEVAYKLGFCYNELQLYKQAYYYLNMCSRDGKIDHIMEFVNTLVNGKDHRTLNFLDEIMAQVQENYKDDEEVPGNVLQLVNFLKRRRAYTLINFGQLDAAEKIFTQMLNEEENADYAINELEYIKRLREQQGNGEDGEELGVKS